MTGFDFGFFLWGMGPGVNLLVKRAKGVVDGGVSPVVDFKPAARGIRFHHSGLSVWISRPRHVGFSPKTPYQ